MHSNKRSNLKDHQILSLLEGDVSDLGIEDSEDDLDIVENDSLPVIPPNIDDEQTQMESDEDGFDSEDELPLSFFQKRNKKNYKWRQMEFRPAYRHCNTAFSDPPMEEMTPLQYFKYFFDDDLISEIADQTNLYSVQKTGKSVKTNPKEIEQFLGMQILSGIVKMPSYRMYWAEASRYPPISDTMARNRFDCLRTYIHFVDNGKLKQRTDPDYDKLFKIRPVLDAIRKNMATLEPEEHNSVDEIIIPFKGRSSIKQYIKNKPHKWGFKMFARAGSSGLLYDCEIYVGKGTTLVSSLGISGDIVIRLCKNIPLHKNYKLYCDNWFTSPQLFLELHSRGILPTGTVRNNRLPNCNFKGDKALKAEGRGSFDWRVESNSNLVGVKWFDNKAVHLLSTWKGIEPIDLVKRWSVADKAFIEVQRPNVVKQYNERMGGVDLHDMLVALYRINFGVKRSYLRIFYNLVDTCVVNAWLLYKRHMKQANVKKIKPLLPFRAEIAHSLLKVNRVARNRGRPSSAASSPIPAQVKTGRVFVPKPTNDVRFDQMGHFPLYIEKKQRCRLCIKAYSRWKCEKCEVALCLNKDNNCFKSFHCK